MKTVLIRLFLSLVFLTGSSAWAQKTYTVGVEEADLTPIFAAKSPDQPYHGVARDILDRFAKSERMNFVYVPLPVKRFLQDYWSGKFDFAFPDNPNWNVEEKKKLKIHYSDSFLSFEDAVLVLPNKLGQGVDKIKIIGTVRGFTVWKFQAEIDAKKMRVEEAPTPEALIQMGLLGRVDAINLSLQSANYHLKKIDRPGALVADPDLLPVKVSSYYFSSIQHPQVIKKFNQFLKKEAAEISRLKKEKGL